MRSHASVVVIGGGAVGAACLYHLTLAGVRDCLLIEKNELTSGSTWHAAGHIPTYANSWLGMRAGNYAWQLYKELAQTVDYPIAYHLTGAFWPAHSSDRMDLYRHLVGVSRSAGLELAMLTPAQMHELNPFYRPAGSVVGGIHDPYEGDIDPSQLTQALARGARAAGAQIARFTQVTSITRTRSGEWRIGTDKGEVTCEAVVNAAGFYGAKIAELAGQQLPVVTLEHQYLVTDPLPALRDNPEPFALVRDPDVRFYLRRERDSLLLGSYGHEGRIAFADGLPDDFSHQLFDDSVDDMGDVLMGAIEQIPLLGEAGVQRFVNGPIAYAPDALPLCGPAAGLPNFYHACGIQIGITHSAAVGKSITEWITAGETEWDLSAWDPRRFGDWATPRYAADRTVELYGLQYAIPYPHRLLKSARPLQCTPLYDTLLGKGAVFGQIGGWERALWFDTEGDLSPDDLSFRDEPWQRAVQRECLAVRDGVGVMDHGGFTKYRVRGNGAKDFLERVFCAGVPAPGRLKLAYMLTPKGMLWSEATIACLGIDDYLLCGPTLADRRDFDWLQRNLCERESAELCRGYERDGALMLMGPRARDLLSRLTDADLSAAAAPWLSVRELRVAGCTVTAMRVSYVGEWGMELHVASSELNDLYTAITHAGGDLELKDFGSYALNAMRLEKGFHAWGADFGNEYTPFDAGLGKFVNADSPDFIGREATLARRNAAPDWRFCGFELGPSQADALPGDPILHGGEVVGYVTSGGTGFRIGKRLALGYLNHECPATGKFTIEILGEPITATLAQTPFYDPRNERMRS